LCDTARLSEDDDEVLGANLRRTKELRRRPTRQYVVIKGKYHLSQINIICYLVSVFNFRETIYPCVADKTKAMVGQTTKS
jgi:hypothetical protein